MRLLNVVRVCNVQLVDYEFFYRKQVICKNIQNIQSGILVIILVFYFFIRIDKNINMLKQLQSASHGCLNLSMYLNTSVAVNNAVISIVRYVNKNQRLYTLKYQNV